MSNLNIVDRFHLLHEDYLKLHNEYREMQNKYHQTRIMLEEEQKRNTTDLTDQIKSLTSQRDAAIEQLRKYRHGKQLIAAAKNMLEMACDYLEVDDD